MVIRNIIFDLGNVILDVKPHVIRTFLASTSETAIDALHEHLFRSGVYHSFEIGAISPEEFRDEVRKFSPDHLSDEAIDQAWNTMLGEIPRPRIELLKKLKDKYRLFLLSNTNEIHYNAYSEYVRKTYNTELEDFFEQSFYSHRMGLRKPDEEIYKRVVQECRIDPSETLFIDDFLENVKASRRLGLKGFHLDEGRDIGEFFDEELNFTGLLS